MFECSICKENTVEHGNNAEPINEGTCCDECNRKVVLPERIHRINWKTNSRQVLN